MLICEYMHDHVDCVTVSGNPCYQYMKFTCVLAQDVEQTRSTDHGGETQLCEAVRAREVQSIDNDL